MAEIYPYARTLLLQSQAQLPLSQGYVRRDEILAALEIYARKALGKYEVEELIDIQSLSISVLQELVSGQAVFETEEDFAGTYYMYSPSHYTQFRDKALKADKVFARSQVIGDRFYPDVFDGYKRSQGIGNVFPDLGFAPAANRVVSFSDNEISELDLKATEIIQAVSGQNQIAELPGLRELMIGQLQAGRELIRAGSTRIYLLELTLIQSLKFLIKRYQDQLIGGLASALLTALVKSIGIDA
ncbi:hypothetical protein [uncultured Sphingomonas sp.]|uniref:hypothetical protein n=1 Tax=uncultured Sphingomonas sp. TaxID=158754 RepID=UPI0035CBD906